MPVASRSRRTLLLEIGLCALGTLWANTLLACGKRPEGANPDANVGDASPDASACTSCAPGEVCLNHNECCPAARVNGNSCCAANEIPFAGRCVQPKAGSCVRDVECGAGYYCETGLGAPGTAPRPECAATQTGVCIPEAPTCTNGLSDGCVRDSCSVARVAGPLNGVLEWEWPQRASGAAWGAAREFPTFIDAWNTPVVGRLADSNCDGNINELDPPTVVLITGKIGNTNCQASSTCGKGILRAVNGQNGAELWSLRSATVPTGANAFADNDTNGQGLLPDASPCVAGATDCDVTADEIGAWRGISPAIGDFNHDGALEIVAVADDGTLAMISHAGRVLTRSSLATALEAGSTGWGGALAVADMNGDGNVEVAYGSAVFTVTETGGVWTIEKRFIGKNVNTLVWGGGNNQATSYFANIDNDADQELICGGFIFQYECGSAGATCQPSNKVAGFAAPAEGQSAVANLDGDAAPELVVVRNGLVSLFDIDATAGGLTLRGAAVADKSTSTTGRGGPITIADFDNDGAPEVGIAMFEYYEIFEILRDAAGSATGLKREWFMRTHDLSSAVTGSSVFDFEGDGKAEVIYNDECFLWVYELDGNATPDAAGERSMRMKFAVPTTSFTGTESSLVVDIDGDGSSEILQIGNDANPSASGWACYGGDRLGKDWSLAETDPAAPDFGRPGWLGPDGQLTPSSTYRGLRVYRASDHSWVNSRTLWNQHAYSVTNICDEQASFCPPGSHYGDIPAAQAKNWDVSFLNNFRQNVQGVGVTDAPDVTLALNVACGEQPQGIVAVRNIGRNTLPAGIRVQVRDATDTVVAEITTDLPIRAGAAREYRFAIDKVVAEQGVRYKARVRAEMPRTFIECDDTNNETPMIDVACSNFE